MSPQPPPFVSSGNPIWDEIQQAHSTLSHPAQRAIAMSGIPQRAAEAEAAPLGQSAAEATPPPMRPIGTPSATPIRGLGTPTAASPEAAHLGELNRVTAPPLAASNPLAHTSADTGRSGIGQIHNRFVRGLASVGDAVGSAVLPNVLRFVPGTSLHHQDVVTQNENIVAGDVARAKSGAEAGHAAAQTQSLLNPAGEYEEGKEPAIDPDHPELGPQAYTFNKKDPADRRFNGAAMAAKPTGPKTLLDLFTRDNPKGTAEDYAKFEEGHRAITNDFEAWAKQNPGKPVADFLKLKAENSVPKEGETPLGERVPNLNAAFLNRIKVLNPKTTALPPEYTLPPNATSKDFERVDKILEATERATGTKVQQDQTRAMQQQMHEDAVAARGQKDETAQRTAVLADHAPAAASAERFNIMAKNYEDAIKNHDQQAMLSLLTNHIGMTLGAQKGARITKDIINEAIASRPWLKGLESKFDENGILSGVTLTPEQMRQMVSLGRERFSEDVKGARSRSSFRGYSGPDPERTPNASTMNHYTALANGDPNKAKELARADGWTVK